MHRAQGSSLSINRLKFTPLQRGRNLSLKRFWAPALFSTVFLPTIYAMELNLSPQIADVTVAEGEGGAYYTWSSSKSPALGQAKLGAGRLVLQPRGFALPHYADCYKIGFVVQGSCRVGIVLPNSSTEHVLTIKKGDAIPVYLAAVTWWYNGENSDAEVIFLGETSKTYTPAQFDYFFLAGAVGVLGGFSSHFVSRDVGQNEWEKLTRSQTGVVIVKLGNGQELPEPSNEACNKMAYNLETAEPFIHVNHGGSMTTADAENVHSLKEFGLSAALVKLEANSTLGPIGTADASSQVFYVFKGSGHVQVSGLGGKNALDAKLQTGDLFVVPRFFAAAIMADGEGLLCFSVLTSSQPSFVEFAGNKSVWKALSPSVLQAALNVDSELVELFKSKIGNGKIIAPPKIEN